MSDISELGDPKFKSAYDRPPIGKLNIFMITAASSLFAFGVFLLSIAVKVVF